MCDDYQVHIMHQMHLNIARIGCKQHTLAFNDNLFDVLEQILMVSWGLSTTPYQSQGVLKSLQQEKFFNVMYNLKMPIDTDFFLGMFYKKNIQLYLLSLLGLTVCFQRLKTSEENRSVIQV